MSQILAHIRMELLSDTVFSSGNSSPGGADITLRTDSQGQLCVPGSTVKGLLREALGNYLCWTGSGTEQDLHELLGHPGVHAADPDRRLVFGDLRLEQQELSEPDCSYIRTFTALKDGAAKATSLHSAVCLRRGLSLSGVILCRQDDLPLVQNSLRLIQWVGLKRSRGFGHVKVTLCRTEPVRPYGPVPAGNWIRYRLRLRSPMSITLGTSAPTDEDRRNYSDGCSYIPGSAIRGMVMSYLSRTDPEWFARNKGALLQEVTFRSAFPLSDGNAQIPTPMGFYEDRTQTRRYSVLKQDVESGHKRARLGRFCRLEDSTLLCSSPAMESSLRITILDPDTRAPLSSGDRQMFTAESMAAGTVLEGCIQVPDPELTPRIAEAFQTWLSIGADRFGGSGLCTVELLDGKKPGDSGFHYQNGDTIPDTLCMLVLSPTALMQHGEVSGLTGGILSGLLGVPSASVERCATSVVQYAGFNRTWGCASETVSMYAPGSIFLIRCSEAPSLERLRALEENGIGIRRNEGCGQVLFLRDFFRITSIQTSGGTADPRRSISTEEILRRRARSRWLYTHAVEGSLSSSQVNNLQALCKNILAGTKTLGNLTYEFKKNLEKSTNRNANYAALQEQVKTLLNTPMYKTLGCAPYQDSLPERLQLFCDLIDLSRKEEF